MKYFLYFIQKDRYIFLILLPVKERKLCKYRGIERYRRNETGIADSVSLQAVGLLSFGARTLDLQVPENQAQVDQRDLGTLKTESPEREDGSSYSASSKHVFLLILGSPFSRVHFVFSSHKGAPFCPKDAFMEPLVAFLLFKQRVPFREESKSCCSNPGFCSQHPD
ncbi:unnamed protein product [Rangifer tarandus platyrhynchus]|uniref:Uncharacterized protein n=1 Tax=Rangifer tarandus platyrhynchus TaxID=3082113 RepID=A0AC59ZWF5_RANTA